MGALVNPQIFNDERDLIIAKWNQLQAFYGNGKIFFQNSSIDVSKDNRLTKFKVIFMLKFNFTKNSPIQYFFPLDNRL